jgi:hypothetical protein
MAWNVIAFQFTAYRAETSHRRRLRMAGRPLLTLINRLITSKTQVGASVQIDWVRAHSAATTIEHVGNRLADDTATLMCKLSTAVQNRVETNLPLEGHEGFVAIRVPTSVNSIWRLLTSDPRRAALKVLNQESDTIWSMSRSQGLFHQVGERLGALWRFACCHQSHACGFIMLSAANAWQYHRVPDHPFVAEELCVKCKVMCTMDHFTRCLLLITEHSAAMAEVTSVLAATGWNGPKRALPLRTFMKMTGIVGDDASMIQVTAACIGAFDEKHVRRRLLLLGFNRLGHDDIVLHLRRALLSWTSTFWR